MGKENISVRERFKRGMEAGKRGDFRQAIIEYDRAIEVAPNEARAYNNRGIAKFALGKYKEAIGDYDKALALKPDYIVAHNNRGNAKVKLGDLKGAIFDYSKALELDSKYATAYLNRAEIKLELGDFEGAIADYNSVIKLKPRSSEAYQGKGIVKAKMGDHQGAADDLDKAATLKPEDKWVGNYYFPEAEIPQTDPSKRKKKFAYYENRDVGDARDSALEEDYLNALINLQLPTETYLRIRMLQRFGYKYSEAAKALGIPTSTLWGTTKRVLKKLHKIMPRA